MILNNYLPKLTGKFTTVEAPVSGHDQQEAEKVSVSEAGHLQE